jgi:hypothetical protein
LLRAGCCRLQVAAGCSQFLLLPTLACMLLDLSFFALFYS